MLAELLAPLQICGLCLEHKAVAVEFSLAEDMDAVVRPVADALCVPVLASHLECAQFDDYGLNAVTHDGSFQLVVFSIKAIAS